MTGHEGSAGEVTLFLDEDDGLLVRGDLQAVDAVLAELLTPGEVDAHRHASSRVADAAAVGASVAAVATTAEEYLRLSSESLEKVARFGAQTDGSGALRGYVRGESGQFAGQLTFDTVSFGAEQALAMQTAAVSMALRSAIADVQAAVERVEEKVSDLQRRIGAREIGEVVGTYGKLDRLVTATTARGHLLDADWDSIAGAGLDLERALESMRAYVTNTVGSIEANASLPKRESSIKRLADPKRVAGTLRLILVAEQALHLWEYLRLERVRRTDPEHVQSALDEARQSLRAHHARDGELVAQTAEAIAKVCTIGPLEIHHFLAIPGVRKASERALGELDAFANATRIPLPEVPRTIRRPQLSETRDEAKRQAIAAKDNVVDVTQTASRATTRGAKKVSERIRRSLPR